MELPPLRGVPQQWGKGEPEVLELSGNHSGPNNAYEKGRGNPPSPILADGDKPVPRRYGVLNEERGVAQRSLFLIDYRGYIRWRNPHYDWRSQEQYAQVTEAMLALPMIPRPKQATPRPDPPQK